MVGTALDVVAQADTIDLPGSEDGVSFVVVCCTVRDGGTELAFFEDNNDCWAAVLDVETAVDD